MLKGTFNKRAIITLAQQIKPVVSFGGKTFFIEPVEVIDAGYLIDPRISMMVEGGLEKIGEVITEHVTGGIFFKPSIAEVLSQIPNNIMNQNPVAFEIVEGALSSDRKTSHGRTVFYKGRLPQTVKQQPVIWRGKKITAQKG